MTHLAGISITESNGFKTPLNTTHREINFTLHSEYTYAYTLPTVTQYFPIL